ncbi:CoA transferase [Streptomyces sp. NPDC088194]|uniref:CaiB/BaiF CoA-transferase family protein n=1 Tax=Streptomyces sp. NPDC088194 TaxID=3154931 RepID=UPI00344FCD7E
MSDDRHPRHAGVSPLRVVELTTGIAGQACGRLFAGLGHDVLRCEPAGGDPLRTQAPLGEDGTGCTFSALNAGKHSTAIDVGTEAGRVRLSGQLADADVLITDMGPGAADAMGLSAARLRATWPHLVVVWLTPYGLDDDRSDGYGDSLLAESYGGLAWMIGEPSRSPLSLGGEQAAHASAFVGFFGAMLALYRGGDLGEVVDVALCDVVAYLDWKSTVSHAHGGPLPTRTGASTGLWRIVPAADGWIGVIFQPDQWDAVVALVDDPALADPELRHQATRLAEPERWWPVVEAWAARLPKQEVYRRAQRLGLPFGYSADIADLSIDPQFRARGFLAETAEGRALPISPLARSARPPRAEAGIPRSGDDVPPHAGHARRGAPPAPDAAPLEGLVVLDLGTITAGAATARLLADYGATVIKIEAPDRPDAFRVWSASGPGATGATSPLFASNNAGKLAVTLDLKSDADRAEMTRLVADADVLVENYTVGVTERLGIDHASLHAINPRLVFASLSSQGQSGPDAHGRSYGATLDLLSGLASVTGYRGGGPCWSSADVNYPDQLVSLMAAGMIVHCLHMGLRGEHLDVSQREVVSWTLADRIAEYADTGRIPAPEGNRRPGRTPHDVYPCADLGRWVAIGCHRDIERASLAAVLGRPSWVRRPFSWWQDHADEVDQVIARWTVRRSRAHCVSDLTEAGVPCAPVNTAADREHDPRFTNRRVFLDDPPRKGFPMRLLGYHPPDPGPAPDIGQDNATLLAGAREAGTGDRDGHHRRTAPHDTSEQGAVPEAAAEDGTERDPHAQPGV